MTSIHEHLDLANPTDATGAPMDPQPEQPHPDDLARIDESDPDREATAAERLDWRRQDAFIPADESNSDEYPTLGNISAAFMFSGVIRPLEPTQPEFAAIALDPRLGSEESTKAIVAVSKWNMLWEAGQFRRRFFDENELPEPMASIADLGDVNITFVPRTRSRYFEYAPMLHLLPKRTLETFGLPVLRGGMWPFLADDTGIDDFLPDDFETRLSRAWAWTVWRHLESGSKMRAFTCDDPIKLLAHNLDFWLPAVTATIQDRLREFPEVDKGKDPSELGIPVTLEDGSTLPGATGHPRMGGPVWRGEEEAGWVVEDTVERADETGRLRDIIDAVRSHRIEDDFSDHWSYAREDFERKLHGKRRKVKVTFVEVPDTTPVQGPESEVVGNLVTNDFMAMLDARNQQIVVLLNSGFTSKTEIAGILGYANHSAVCKRLVHIRGAAERFFDQS